MKYVHRSSLYICEKVKKSRTYLEYSLYFLFGMLFIDPLNLEVRLGDKESLNFYMHSAHNYVILITVLSAFALRN